MGANGGGEFDGRLQIFLNERGIKREKTLPHTPQYSGVAKRALGILRDKTVALLRGVTERKNDHLWAETMRFVHRTTNGCVTVAFNGSTSPCQLWCGCRSHLDSVPTFGALGYLRRFRPELKLAPHGVTCTMLRLAERFPRKTFRVQGLNTSEILFRQAVTWHPPPATKKGPGRLAKTPQNNTGASHRGAREI